VIAISRDWGHARPKQLCKDMVAMISYLERYLEFASLNYDNKRIWAELMSLGADIRQEPLYSDARAVARQATMRARQNVETLIERLNTLEYRFLVPQEVWIPPDEASAAALDALELQYGLLPLSLRMWYEVVGSVNFMGAHPTLSYFDSPDMSSSSSLPVYADPLVMNPFESNPLSFYLDLVYEYTGEEIADPPYSLRLAPDAVHKANHSGGGPTQILFPNPAMDAPLISDDWDGIPFVSYLRTCFEWGGFPGWRTHPEYPKEELEFLTKDLLSL
jgi:hypothetical protein